MAVLPVNNIAAAGTAVTLGAVTASDTFAANANTVLVVANASGGSINVTLTATANAADGTAASNRVIVVPNGATRYIRMSQGYLGADGTVTAAFSGTTSVTAAVIQV